MTARLRLIRIKTNNFTGVIYSLNLKIKTLKTIYL